MKMMVAPRIKLWRFFSISELFFLLLGKFFSTFRTEEFQRLQDKENKLQMLRSSSDIIEEKGVLTISSIINKTKLTMSLRLAGSDILSFNQIINNEEYRPLLNIFRERFFVEPLNIIDAGANVGLATLYFKAMCVNSKIVAIEPDDANYKLAVVNARKNNLSDVEIIKAALWPVKSRLAVVNDFRDMNEWSLRVEAAIRGEIESVTPEEIIDQFGSDIDIFKIDIEGSEETLLSEGMDREWIRRVKVLAIEIHDEFNIRPAIHAFMEQEGFQAFERGEMTIFCNSRFDKFLKEKNGSHGDSK